MDKQKGGLRLLRGVRIRDLRNVPRPLLHDSVLRRHAGRASARLPQDRAFRRGPDDARLLHAGQYPARDLLPGPRRDRSRQRPIQAQHQRHARQVLQGRQRDR